MTPGRLRRIVPPWTILASLFSLLIAASSCPADDAVRKKFLAEYPAAARRLAESLVTLKGSVTLSQTMKNRTGTVKGEFAVDHEYAKLTFDRSDTSAGARKGSKIRHVFCGKGRAIFQLRKPSKSQTYVVTDAGLNVASYAADELDEKLLNLVRAPYCVDWINLAEALSGTEFLLDDVSESVVDGLRTVTVRLRQATDPASRMRVELEPERGWAIRHSVWERGDDERMKTENWIEYGTPSSGVPELRSVTHREGLMSYQCRFDRISHEPTPAAEFRMEYYGLPDLTPPTDRLATVFRWVLLIAVAGLVTFGVIRAIRHGRQR